uniref:Uncharacterized protein n=1 Tax=Glossina pallidipes TaxID=7398 RepID=A0A1A9ZL24_GLOPL
MSLKTNVMIRKIQGKGKGTNTVALRIQLFNYNDKIYDKVLEDCKCKYSSLADNWEMITLSKRIVVKTLFQLREVTKYRSTGCCKQTTVEHKVDDYALLRYAGGTAERIVPNEWVFTLKAVVTFAATAKTVNIMQSFMVSLISFVNEIQQCLEQRSNDSYIYMCFYFHTMLRLAFNSIQYSSKFRGKRCAQIPNKTGASQEYFGLLIFTPVAAKAELTATKTISTTMQSFMASGLTMITLKQRQQQQQS